MGISAKSRYLKISPKVDFEISHILESSILSYLKDLVQEQCFHIKMDL